MKNVFKYSNAAKDTDFVVEVGTSNTFVIITDRGAHRISTMLSHNATKELMAYLASAVCDMAVDGDES